MLHNKLHSYFQFFSSDAFHFSSDNFQVTVEADVSAPPVQGVQVHHWKLSIFYKCSSALMVNMISYFGKMSHLRTLIRIIEK